jgi:protein-S-isoprenylcysteine O-methyltransferase Ste14
MRPDSAIRLASATVLVGAVATSGFYRARAERLGGRLPTSIEGRPAASLRVAIGLVVVAAIVAPIVAPSWAGIITVPLPPGVRLLGLGLAIAAWPFLWWTLATIGTGISPSVSTRADATLVTSGPYGLVRHPLYSGGFLAFLGLGLSLQSIPLLIGVAILLWWLPQRVRREEANLTTSYGDGYRAYCHRTGRFLPRLRAGS